MHPDTHERRRSLNIERFAAAREWDKPVDNSETTVSPEVQPHLISLVTRAILTGVMTLTILVALALPALIYGVLPNWQTLLTVAVVLGLSVIAWGMTHND